MVRKAKKRGVKPVAKRGKRKLIEAGWKIGMDLNEVNIPATYTPVPVLTLCGQLEDSIVLLETRISNAIAKINSLM